MADPAAYRAPVVRTDPYSVEYENGQIQPRQGSALQDALIFEGVQPMPQAPMGGFGAGPQTADAADFLRTPEGALRNFAAQQAAPPAAPDYPSAMPQLGRDYSVGGQGPSAGAAYGQGVGVAGGPSAAPPVGLAGLVATAPGDNRVADTRPYTPPPGGAPVFAPPPQGQAPPQGYAGGGGSSRTSTTTQTQQGVPLDPALLARMNDSRARGEVAIQDSARVRGEAAANDANALAFQDIEQQRLHAQRAESERDRQKAMQVASDDYRRAITDFESKTVDPAKWYHDRGTGGTIAAAIAMGLGAFGSSLTGGPNAALEIIQGAIRDDIDAQKQNIATAGRGLEAQHGLLADMRQRFGDERDAELATEAALLRRAATQAQQREAEARAAGAEPEGELASAQLALAADERQAEILDRAGNRVTISRTQAQSAGGGRGAGGRAPTPTEMRQYSDRRAVSDRARSVLGRIEQQLSSIPEGDDVPGIGITSSVPNFLLTTEGRRLRGDIGSMTAEYLHATTGAVATQAEREAAVNVLEGLTDTDFRQRVGQMRTALDASDQNLAAGFSPEVLQTYAARGGEAAPRGATPLTTARRVGE